MPLNIRKFAAIDIGSNAIRLLVSTIIPNGDTPFFKKSLLLRVPIRLGADTFTKGENIRVQCRADVTCHESI